MTANEKQIDDLLSQLDKYARDCDSYDSGLPIDFVDDDREQNDLRNIVKKWLNSIEKES